MHNSACMSAENKKRMVLGTGKVGENTVKILLEKSRNEVTIRRKFVVKADFTDCIGHVILLLFDHQLRSSTKLP